jgi:hypothetical protein
VKWSANWWGHPSSVFKNLMLQDNLGHVGALWATFHSIGDQSNLTGRAITEWVDLLQAYGDHPGSWGGSVRRGSWTLIELLIDMRSTTRVMRLYINGSQVAVVNWVGGAATALTRAWISGIMGGIGPTGNPSEQKFYVDRVRVSTGR